ncbi:MAG: rRNA ((527)-N(7))-methyltransferase RsmG [Bacteroidota bacterium]
MNPEIIFRYFPDLTSGQREQFIRLAPLYAEWNAKINVISRKDMDAFYVRHVLHSLGIATVATFAAGTAVVDVGTGGGFPGIPLAILFPETRFHLVDSIGKKIKVVEAVATALGLENVSWAQARAETLPTASFDFVVTRAVTDFQELYGWTRHLIRPGSSGNLKNGILALKGGDLEEELSPFKRKIIVFDLKNHFSEDFFETKKLVYLPM